MLTSSANQYLRPEYLTPLPTTLDAKKSPLALLAQTCSQIGADSPNTKSLLPPLEKSSKSAKSESQREKASPASSVGSNSVCDVVIKSSFKPYESCTQRDKSRSPEERGSATSLGSRVRTPSSSKSSVVAPLPLTKNARCNSNNSASSPPPPRGSPVAVGRKTPVVSSNSTTSSSETSPTPKVPASDSTSLARSVASPLATSKAGFTPSIVSTTDSAIKDYPLGPYKGAGLPVGYPGAYPGIGSHFPMDLMASHQHMKAGLNPYMSYARMKTPSGVDTLVPVCRDPYCTGCQLSSHLLASSAASAAAAGKGSSTAAGPCPGGCAQCDHATAAGKGSFLSAGHQHSAAAAAYAHAQLAALAAASHLPYVCSWIAGDAAYCGKRFSNSEELLQHLRTHTNLSSSAAESSAALSMLSHHGLPPNHPLFHRTYPTPPLSPLAAGRYHPYSKPPHLPPSLSASSLGFPLHPHPGIPPYFSPYSLYGQRLGAASGMHP